MSDYELVLMLWADAHAGDGHWATLDEDETGEHIIETCGYLIREEDGGKASHFTIAQSVSPDGFVDHVIHIPQAMMRELFRLTKQESPKEN